MEEITLPAHGWKPRDYQLEAWDYLKNGGKHAELIWHRRSGKDEICLHHAACEMVTTPGGYWHMLPKQNQVRKAIWDAVNPHTGRRRVLEAFPPELFTHRDTDMFIRCKANASTWQCIGSDNYEGAIGSSAKGVVYSEWAQANPSARGYIRPMLTENDGYQIFITTPRGRNHAYSTFTAALENKNQFAQLLSIRDTKTLKASQLLEELKEYVSTYGEAMGLALYEQEYECSFEAAILGAYYGAQFARIDQDGRITTVPHDPDWPVHVAMDIGYDDDTAIWFFQVVGREIHVIDVYFNSNQDVDHYCGAITGRDVQIDFVGNKLEVSLGENNVHDHRREYRIGSIHLPHDARAKTLAAKGKSVEEQFAAVFGWNRVNIVPQLSVEDGIQATRKLLDRAYFDHKTEEGLEACRQYHREWDDEKKMFKDKPLHDWTSHFADGMRYLAVVWNEDKIPKDELPVRYALDRNFNEMMAHVKKRRLDASRDY